VTVPQVQDTNEDPMRAIFSRLSEKRTESSLWSGSILCGFPYFDVARLGMSVYTAADRDARAIATDLASFIWSQRRELRPELIGAAEVLSELEKTDGPVVLVDVADNVGGGSPGDGTTLLALLEERAGRDGVIVIWDPQCIQEIYATGRAAVRVRCGGKTGFGSDSPVEVEGRVDRIGVVSYKRSGSYMSGQQVNMGSVAIVHSGLGKVVITENRVMPFDSDHLAVLEIDVATCRVIVTKSAIAWKAAFGDLGATVFYVDAPGRCPSDLARLTYHHRPVPLYPIEPDTSWP
jgi:microcystin degradation protein MlrC